MPSAARHRCGSPRSGEMSLHVVAVRRPLLFFFRDHRSRLQHARCSPRREGGPVAARGLLSVHAHERDEGAWPLECGAERNTAPLWLAAMRRKKRALALLRCPIVGRFLSATVQGLETPARRSAVERSPVQARHEPRAVLLLADVSEEGLRAAARRGRSASPPTTSGCLPSSTGATRADDPPRARPRSTARPACATRAAPGFLPGRAAE